MQPQTLMGTEPTEIKHKSQRTLDGKAILKKILWPLIAQGGGVQVINVLVFVKKNCVYW
jgi:hypothetical protein